jgi:S-adenosylmethionine-diacylglycerol 3-amino-3-carboxypropyl transferase
MKPIKEIVHKLNRRLFDSVVKNNLIYNSCWEDPKIDRALLGIGEDSEVVMLTSAGCNALDYLLDEPAAIHCIDANPAQNALLELKRSLFTATDHDTLWEAFGRGRHAGFTPLYHNRIRQTLSSSAQNFWDSRLDYFSPSASKPSFYFRGTSGTMAYMIYKRLRHKGLYGDTLNLLDAKSLSEQRYYFEEIESQLWNTFSRWLLRRDATMAMLGVPKGQRKMIEDEVSGGLAAFIHQSVKEVFTNRCLRNNYFWRVYLTGSYTPGCCPNYLKFKNFSKLSKRIDALTVNTSYLSHFLSNNPGSYSHFILLDHQDWMAHHKPNELAREWKLILRNARPGAKILFRSAGKTRAFIPDFVHSCVQFRDDQCRRWHARDRVGTYGSTHLAIVDKSRE